MAVCRVSRMCVGGVCTAAGGGKPSGVSGEKPGALAAASGECGRLSRAGETA